MRRRLLWAVSIGVPCSLLAFACSDGSVVRRQPPDGQAGEGAGNEAGASGSSGQGGMPALPMGKGVGEACSEAAPCREGLSCNGDDECEPSGTSELGAACVISGECADGQCVARQCTAAGEGETGAACGSDLDCQSGLRCALIGIGTLCAPEGSGDVGAGCNNSADCFAGLSCAEGACGVPAPGLPTWLSGKPWSGVECAPPAKSGIKAFFEVPGAAGADEGDFFRLPFPSDVRRSSKGLDLSGFPTPGSGLLGVDPVQLYVDAIEEQGAAWGVYPTVTFRFSGEFDAATLAPNQSVKWLDLSAGLSAGERERGWQRFNTGARSHYVCENQLGVQPPFGVPLEPGHTYAVLILSTVSVGDDELMTLLAEDDTTSCDSDDDCDSGVCAEHEQGGHCEVPVLPSANMSAMLASTPPKDERLQAAHAVFAPLREYLPSAQPAIDPSNVLVASVFTVGNVLQPMTELAEAVKSSALPTASDWVKCGSGEPSPCPQAEAERACGDDVDGYDEYHALLTLPVFQQGSAPYQAAGGAIDVSKPRSEAVCMAITVPEGTPPTAGWPAIVYAHGTGGSFRNHVTAAVAGALSSGSTKFAVIGIDQVEHGPRRGDSSESPNNLFFNFLNPAATRGNPLQGAADQLSLARFAKALDASAEQTHGAAIKLDPEQLYFFGHSQGSTEGSLMLPFADEYKAAVLSGNGASLRDALRTKTKPENIAGALPFVLQDPLLLDPNIGQSLTLYHPVLSLLQQWIDPADPLSFARALAKPLDGHLGKHVFVSFGVADSYSPPITIATFARAGGFVQATPDASAEPVYDAIKIKTVSVPLSAEAPNFTLGMRQYGAPSGSDGHFVVFDNETANADMVRFFSTATGASPPSIGE